jgi:putative ABC transport system ATP-binding protein
MPPTDTLSSSTLAVAATDLVKVYGTPPAEVRALDGISATFPSGELTAIMGPSGSGKSTFMHVLAGLDRPTSGGVAIGATTISDLSDRELSRLRRTQVGFVFQSFNLVPSLTAADNIRLPLRLDGRKPDPDWFDAIVTTVGLGERLDHRPAELSGGQQQRVAVARALLTRPAVVFADEPTGNLDSNASAEVLSFLRRSVREHGQTIVMVTHDPHAAAYADRVLFLADGRIVGESRDVTVPTVLDRMRTLGG